MAATKSGSRRSSSSSTPKSRSASSRSLKGKSGGTTSGRTTKGRGSSAGRGGSRSGGGGRAGSQVTTDHAQIRRWAEARGGQPACVRGTGGRGDTGMIRLDFPGFGGAGKLEPISWDEWFEQFDRNDLALLYQETTAGGERSNFNKLVARPRGNAKRGGAGSSTSRNHGRSAATGGGKARGAAAAAASKSKSKKTTTKAKARSSHGR